MHPYLHPSPVAHHPRGARPLSIRRTLIHPNLYSPVSPLSPTYPTPGYLAPLNTPISASPRRSLLYHESPFEAEFQQSMGYIKLLQSSQDNVVIGNKYRISEVIGNGSFGTLYKGTRISTGDEVAIKVERKDAPYPQLQIEVQIYRILQGNLGVPRALWYGSFGDHSVLIMDLLGPSLEDKLEHCGQKFSIKTVALLAIQMIQLIHYAHSKGILHRDIKPDNFLMGRSEESTRVRIIDFGLAKQYRDPITKRHIPYREGKSLIGTARYASINTHRGFESSRRDDLEYLGYVLLYFLRGSLPWQSLEAEVTDDQFELIAASKITTPISTLCQGLPYEFAAYVKYCRELGFYDEPNYTELRKLFYSVLVRSGYEADWKFDWMDDGLGRLPTPVISPHILDLERRVFS